MGQPRGSRPVLHPLPVLPRVPEPWLSFFCVQFNPVKLQRGTQLAVGVTVTPKNLSALVCVSSGLGHQATSLLTHQAQHLLYTLPTGNVKGLPAARPTRAPPHEAHPSLLHQIDAAGS